MSRTVIIPGASEIEIMARLPVKEKSWLTEERNFDKMLIVRAVVTPSENGECNACKSVPGYKSGQNRTYHRGQYYCSC